MPTNNSETHDNYRAFGEEVANEIWNAAGDGASVDELMDILDSSGFDGDICEFL